MCRNTVSFRTVGCRLNQYETDLMKRAFVERGYSVVPFDEPASVCVVNTCTVTGRSDYRSRQIVRRAHRVNPEAVLVVTGCYAQSQPQASASIAGVDLVVGNAGKTRLPDLLALRTGRPAVVPTVVMEPLPSTFEEGPLVRGRIGGRTRAFLKIQDGCDHACAYCAVRIARGRSRSRTWEAIAREAEAAIEAGHREIVLTGVNLGSYGRDLDEGLELADVVDRVASLPGIGRVRLSSVEPHEITPKLVDLIRLNPRVCRHVHVPLQSGSTGVLRRMNRTYDPDDYAELVRQIAAEVPGCGIGADVMVGFPGEGGADFQRTLDLVGSLPLSYLHVFSYSPRPKTAAAEMGPAVPGEVKKARSHAMQNLGLGLARRFRERLAGETLRVLFEVEEGEERVVGLADNYVKVGAAGTRALLNEFCEVRVTGASSEGLWGTVGAEPVGLGRRP